MGFFIWAVFLVALSKSAFIRVVKGGGGWGGGSAGGTELKRGEAYKSYHTVVLVRILHLLGQTFPVQGRIYSTIVELPGIR